MMSARIRTWVLSLALLSMALVYVDTSQAAPPRPPGFAGGVGPPGTSPPPRDPVPEPATAVLIGLGAAGMYGLKKLKDSRKSAD